MCTATIVKRLKLVEKPFTTAGCVEYRFTHCVFSLLVPGIPVKMGRGGYKRTRLTSFKIQSSKSFVRGLLIMSVAAVINRRRNGGEKGEMQSLNLDDMPELTEIESEENIHIVDSQSNTESIHSPPPPPPLFPYDDDRHDDIMEEYLKSHVIETSGGSVFFLSKDAVGQQLVSKLIAFKKKRAGYFSLFYFLCFLFLFMGIMVTENASTNNFRQLDFLRQRILGSFYDGSSVQSTLTQQEILPWLKGLVGEIWVDARCGDGVCSNSGPDFPFVLGKGVCLIFFRLLSLYLELYSDHLNNSTRCLTVVRSIIFFVLSSAVYKRLWRNAEHNHSYNGTSPL